MEVLTFGCGKARLPLAVDSLVGGFGALKASDGGFAAPFSGFRAGLIFSKVIKSISFPLVSP